VSTKIEVRPRVPVALAALGSRGEGFCGRALSLCELDNVAIRVQMAVDEGCSRFWTASLLIYDGR